MQRHTSHDIWLPLCIASAQSRQLFFSSNVQDVNQCELGVLDCLLCWTLSPAVSYSCLDNLPADSFIFCDNSASRSNANTDVHSGA